MNLPRRLAVLALMLPLGAALPGLVPPAPAVPAADAVRAGKYTVDAVHSVALFRINHLGVANFYGRFNAMAGEFTLDMDDLDNSGVLLALDAASVDTNSSNRDNHIRSKDFLDVENHREVTFRSTSVTRRGERLMLEGELTLHGVTRELQAELQLVGAAETFFGDYRVGLETTLTFDRSDFGMDFMLDKLGNEIAVTVSLEGILQEQE